MAGAFSKSSVRGFRKGVKNGYLAFSGVAGGGMANIFRVTLFFLALFVATAAPAQVANDVTPVDQYCSDGPWIPRCNALNYFAAPHAVCQAVVNALVADPSIGGIYAVSVKSAVVGAAGCEWQSVWIQNPVNVSYGTTSIAKAPTQTCPVNSSLAAGKCICKPGFKPNAAGTSCEAPNGCPAAGVAAGDFKGPGRNGPKILCDQSINSGDSALPFCEIAGHSMFSYSESTTGADVWFWLASMKFTNKKCLGGSGTGSPPDGIKNDGPSCVPPKVSGLVNGAVVCYTPSNGTSTDSKAPPTSNTTTAPNGDKKTTTTSSDTQCAAGTCTTTTTHSTTTTPSGGSPSAPSVTTSTSSCQQGPGCSPIAPLSSPTTSTSTSGADPTSTTITTGGGGGGGGGGDGDGIAGFCAKNPGAKMCKSEPDSSFGGACGASPVCTGDAVMCAVAAATFTTNCALTTRPADTPEGLLYKAEALKPQGDQTGPITQTVNIGPAAFDQTNVLGGSGGVGDLSVTVAGRAIVLPFSFLNIWFTRLGYILKAITFLICARILLKR